MSGVQEATDALRAALREKDVKSHVQDAFDNLAPCLVLLNSTCPSVAMIRKLCTVFRQPFLPLYNACLQPALRLSSSVLSAVLGKLCDAHNAEDDNLRVAWDTTAEAILSGVLDFLDQEDSINIELDGGAAEALCCIICEFFFLDPGCGFPAFTTLLSLSAYNVLTETVARHVTIRNLLHQSAVLGGERLGAAISGTRDYLLLEALLMLFARLLPPAYNTSQGKLRRAKFVKEVLGSPKLFRCSTELLDTMQNTSDIHWDNVAARIIDILARSDITYPQPFAIDEIHVCGRVFPQPLATDRLIMDRQAFLVDIVVENDEPRESLQVPYTHIRTITLDNSEENVPKGRVLVTIYMASPPLVANAEMKPDTNHLHAKFLLQNDALARFMEALRRRGVGKLSFLNPQAKAERKHKSISIGSGFKFTNDSSPSPPTTSFEGKVQHVNQVYKTDIENPSILQADPLPRTEDPSLTPHWKPPLKNENPVPNTLEPSGVEDVCATLESTKSPSFINKTNLARNSFRTRHVLDDGDELSEISEFEAENTTSGRAGAKGSVSCNNALKPTQQRKGRMRTDKDPVTTSEGSRESPHITSKSADRTGGVARWTPETEKLRLTLYSPMFGASSSTQIDVSPKLLSNTDTLPTMTGTEGVGGLSLASQDFVGADPPKAPNVTECATSDIEPITTLSGKPLVGPGSEKDGLRQRAERSMPTSGANREVHSCIMGTKGTSDLPQIVGSRRRRESIEASSKSTVEVVEGIPPRKKCRGDRIVAGENKAKSRGASLGVVPTSRATRYPRTSKHTTGTDPTVDVEELAELKLTCQGTRRSSRIKRRQAEATGGTRSHNKHGRTQKKQAVSQSAAAVTERKEPATTDVQEIVVESHRTKPVLSPRPLLPVDGGPPFSKISSRAYPMERSEAEGITTETNVPRKQPGVSLLGSHPTSSNRCFQGNNSLDRATSQSCVTPDKESKGNLDFFQEAISDMAQLDQEQFFIKNKQITDDQHITSDARVRGNEINQARGVVEHPVSLQGSGNHLVEPSRPIMESTPGKQNVAIDLTRDDSPTGENIEPRKTSADPAHPGADIQMKLRTPNISDGTESAFVLSPRVRRRSVTFASPIEYVLDKKLQSEARSFSARASDQRSPDLFDTGKSRQRASPFEGNPLSPLRVPARSVNTRHGSPGRINMQATSQKPEASRAPLYDRTADEVGIQDIVEVLDEIQTVIIQGISNKFRNVKRNVHHGRDELVQQVLDELRVMVIENAQYFNGLLRLEEEYYKICKAIVHCWEELIDCNDGLAVRFQNALKEHDQNVSARTFPKSLLPMQPVIARCRANA